MQKMAHHWGYPPSDVQRVLSNIKRALRAEKYKQPPNNPKIAKLVEIISELEGAISNPENFNLDSSWLDAARNVSATKAGVFGEGPIGQLLSKGRGGGAKIQIEETASTVLPDGPAQRSALRQLQSAMTRLFVGENAPVIRGERTEENPTGLEINPLLTQDAGLSESILARYAEAPPAPFEQIRVSPELPFSGKNIGYRVADGTPVTQENIDIVRGILWDRFGRLYTARDGLDTSSAQRFIQNNEASIKWLEDATGERSAFRDITAAEDTVRILKQLDPNNIDKIIRDLREAGAFEVNPSLTEDSLRVILEEAARTQQNLASFQVFTGDMDIRLQGDRFLTSVLESSNPGQIIDEVLHVLKQGELPDGTNPSLEGFKEIIGHAIHSRIRSSGADGTPVGSIAERLNAHLGLTAGAAEIKLYDYAKLRNLLDTDQPGGVQFRTLLDNVYGGPAWERVHGDTTPSDYFSIFANNAAEQQMIVTEAALNNVPAQMQFSNELIGNLGRVAGLYFLSKTGLINALVAAGIGRRAAIGVAQNIRQSGVERLIYEGLVDPEFSALLMKKHSKLTDAQRGNFLQRIVSIGMRQVWDRNLARAHNAVEDSPGAIIEVIRQAADPESTLHAPPETLEEQREDRGLGVYDPNWSPIQSGPGASLDLSPNTASVLSQVSGIGSPQNIASSPMLTPTTVPGTSKYSGQQVFGPTDPIFAAHGGYINGGDARGVGRRTESGIMSLGHKPRQMVL